MTTDPLLTARGITKRYHQNAVPAVDNANLRLHGGSIHGIVGENGAGKSTLMHVIAGAVTPESGTVEMRGRRLDLTGSSSALEAGIVISFQHPRMVDSLSVWENLVLGDEPGNRFGIIDRSAAIQRISDSGLAVPGLDLNSRVKNLSSGRVRLVSLMAAIMRLPTAYGGVLILDEPTAACGPDETLAIMEVMRGQPGPDTECCSSRTNSPNWNPLPTRSRS